MKTWYELDSKKLFIEVLTEWWNAVRWKDDVGTARLPIQSVRVMERDVTLYASSAKGRPDWTEEQALVDLMSALEDELPSGLNPETRTFKIRLSPFADEGQSKSKSFCLINRAQLLGRSLRAEEVGDAPPPHHVESSSLGSNSIEGMLTPLLSKTQGDITININDLLLLVTRTIERAYSPIYDVIGGATKAMVQVMEYQRMVSAAAIEVLHQHPSMARQELDHARHIRELEIDREVKLQEKKEEGRAKVVGQIAHVFGSNPEGQLELLTLLSKLNRLLPS